MITGRNKFGHHRVSHATLLRELSEATYFSEDTVKWVSDTLFNIIRTHINNGEECNIDNFGVFHLRDRKPRISHNVHGGAPTYTPPKTTIAFRPARKWYWEHFRLTAVVPPESIPEGCQLSQRAMSTRFYKDMQRELSALCQ